MSETKARRATSIRLFMLITGVQTIAEARPSHPSQFHDAMAAFPKHFLRSTADEHRT